ncbi:MAG: hypothetical protein KF838_02060 [Phycisphaeraceae bacterium]|nr:MAG: hypothetical protein KF838_02060 [Phycisphaeraceae bacterium]
MRRSLVVAAVVALPVLCFLLLTQSPLTAWIVVPVLSNLTGADVDIGHATIRAGGTLTVQNVRAKAPGVSGPAATFVEVPKVEIEFKWRELLTSRRVRNITLHEPRIRLSQSADTQTLNVSGLTLFRPAGTSAGPLPTIVIDDAALEIGEHTGADYSPLSVIHFDASVIPDPASPSNASTIRVAQLAPDGPIVGIPGQFITGRIDADSVTIEPGNLSLASLRPSTLPSAVRAQLERLNLAGRLQVRKFEYTFATGKVEAEIRLSGIAMNLTELLVDDPDSSATLRMSGVAGIILVSGEKIRADLRGTLADLPWTVRLDYAGPNADSAFTCDLATDGFHVTDRPDLLPFAPLIVQERLASFSNPTATVSSRVRIARDAPTPAGASPIRVSGTLDFRDGVAAYVDFPYQFEQMSGSVRFDDEHIELLKIAGVAPSGARLVATGYISPINEEAGVDIRVHVENVPVDTTLENALGPDRREIVTALFNQQRYAELVKAGLVLDPQQATRVQEELRTLSSIPDRSEATSARLAALQKMLDERPLLEPGGRAVVDIHVTRPVGPLKPWNTQVDVRFATLHVLPEAFPLPIVGSDVALRINDKTATLVGGTYTSLRGGNARIDATIDLFTPDGIQSFIPQVDIAAQGIPIDDLLINSIPDRKTTDTRGGPYRPTLEASLRSLNVEGTIDVVARITPKAAPDAAGKVELGYDVRASASSLYATPSGGTEADSSITLAEVNGELHLTDASIVASLAADLVSSPTSSPELERPAGSATARFASTPTLPSSPYELDVRISHLDTSARIEHVIRAFSPDIASRLTSLRDSHHPSGLLDAKLLVRSDSGISNIELTLSDPVDLALDAFGGRNTLSVPEGSVTLQSRQAESAADTDRADMSIRFNRFVAAVDHDDEPIGRIEADGTFSFDMEDTTRLSHHTSLNIAWSDAPLGHQVIRDLVQMRFGAVVDDLYKTHEPDGRFDLDLALRPNPSDTARLGAWGTIRPRFFSITRNGHRMSFPSVDGSLVFSPDGGEVRQLTLNAEGTSLLLNGSWTLGDETNSLLDLSISGWTTAKGSDLYAMLPNQLHDLARDSELAVEGGIRIDELKVRAEVAPEPDASRFAAHGTVVVDRASMLVGPPITDLSGIIEFTARSEPDSASFDVGMIASRLRVANLLVTEARFRVASDADDPTIIAPLITGTTHGGRFSGRATIGPDPRHPDQRRYFASMRIAGARFASVLADLTSGSNGTPPVAPDGSRGLLDGELTVEGVLGQMQSQTGRGEMAISGGEVLSYPLLLPILQVANLQVPSRERLDLALSSFHLSQGRLTFEEMSVFSPTVELFGYGTMSWPMTELDLRIVSRGARQLPIVSSVFEAIRNELISVRVGGTLTSPDVSLEQFASARGLLKRLIDGSASEQAREMQRIRQRAYSSQDRIRRAGDRIKELSRAEAIQSDN